MIEWLKTWTNQIIVAVIIAIIFDLIIPNGKNKKYIKMVINLYVLFVILNPMISKFSNIKEFDWSQYNYEESFRNTNSIETSSSLDANEMINNTVQRTIKENIKSKLLSEGYNATNISININNSDTEYGQINSIKLSVTKIVGNDALAVSKQSNSSIQINTVEEINISNVNTTDNHSLRKSEIKKVKKMISEEYNISENNIEVN